MVFDGCSSDFPESGLNIPMPPPPHPEPLEYTSKDQLRTVTEVLKGQIDISRDLVLMIDANRELINKALLRICIISHVVGITFFGLLFLYVKVFQWAS